MSKTLIIATSLNPDSRSQKLAEIALEEAKKHNLEAEILDLRQFPMPLAGTDTSWDDETATLLKNRMQQFKRFIFAVPVYNYDVNAAAKNLIELCGGSYLEGATAGFICTAGGKSSYMSILNMMNYLMLDFRVWIVPRFVYATDTDWTSKNWQDPKSLKSELRQRIGQLMQDVQR